MSGFFGGLSGHQGALRSAFLIKCGLSKEGFLGSGVVIACLVDIARLAVYGAAFSSITRDEHLVLLLAAIASAFGGTWVGNQLAHKVTIRTIQVIVSIMVFGIAVGVRRRTDVRFPMASAENSSAIALLLRFPVSLVPNAFVCGLGKGYAKP